MSKTRRPSAVGTFNADLPTPEQALKAVAAISGQTAEPDKPAPKKKEKEKSKRKPFTTAILPELIKAIKKQAIEKDIQPADVLEEILKAYFSK